jgi:serine/threonine-protein kinase
MCFVAFPGAPFGLFVGYRVAVELVFLWVYRSTRDRTADIRRLYRELNVSYGVAALGIALMAVHLDGIRSPYMHGISIIALIRAALVPTHWRRALPTFLRIGLAFPLVMGLGAMLSPVARSEWITVPDLTVFASNYVFVVASAVLGLVSGHIVWRTQQQLYRERRVGRYRLQAPIGKGGMGEVWLAWDLTLRRNVALKLLRLEAAQSPDFVKRFEREARAASQLRGPHVVQIYDFGASDDGLYYLAMEYLTGMDLDSLVERFGPLPENRAAGFIMQACRALEEAHAAGIIHRDIKPHNLFVTRVGHDPDFVKLLDFGLVRLREPAHDADSLTWTGFLVGTPAYVAPEIWAGHEADERSDIYALGITLQFLLTGRTPYHYRRLAQQQSEASARESAIPASAEVLSSKALAPIVARCVADRPDARIQTVRELADALLAACPEPPWTTEDAQAFWQAADRARFGGN